MGHLPGLVGAGVHARAHVEVHQGIGGRGRGRLAATRAQGVLQLRLQGPSGARGRRDAPETADAHCLCAPARDAHLGLRRPLRGCRAPRGRLPCESLELRRPHFDSRGLERPRPDDAESRPSGCPPRGRRDKVPPDIGGVEEEAFGRRGGHRQRVRGVVCSATCHSQRGPYSEPVAASGRPVLRQNKGHRQRECSDHRRDRGLFLVRSWLGSRASPVPRAARCIRPRLLGLHLQRAGIRIVA
mmetsp:Transcript_16013/g.46332  ORF Transcript_16013/g.46332 Transcript_16013/m.46332 type:complete len:242 (-) Transcript_16013:1197-1922(-)